MEQELLTAIVDMANNNNQALIDLGFQPIQTIDRFRGQTTEPEKFEYYPTPAIFMAHKTTWNRQGKRYVGNCIVDFHVVYDEPMQTANFFTNKDEALKQAGFYQMVQRLLDDIATNVSTRLMRSNEMTVDTGVVCYKILTYTCETYDDMDSTILIGDDLEVEIIDKKLVKKLG